MGSFLCNFQAKTTVILAILATDSDVEQAIDDNIYGYPNNVERRNFAENDENIESAGSDFDSADNQNVDVNGVSEIAFVNEDTVGQVFISSERDKEFLIIRLYVV